MASGVRILFILFVPYGSGVCDVARYGATGAPPWSQARSWGSHASAWWPGLTPRGPAGLSPKERRGADLPWAHHLQ
ncbi:gastrula zinc finger protein XlCGF7.1-like [Tachysurus ichikawai]